MITVFIVASLGETDVDYDMERRNRMTENTECEYERHKRDCDGDWDCYCSKSGNCPYQHIVKDCDGDIVVLCRK